MILVGIDVGGTFTDLALYDTASDRTVVHKVPSTPSDPSVAIMSGIREICLQAGCPHREVDHIFHGTTVATNAVIQHRGALAGMITTEGYRDIVHIGRHQRPQHYSIRQDIPWQHRPLIRRRHRLTVRERMLPTGEVLTPLDEEAVVRAAQELRQFGVEAVAICFLFAHINAEHEQRAKRIVAREFPAAYLTCSHEVSPQFREFERFTTTAMNAFIGPIVTRYTRHLEANLREAGFKAQLRIMSSNGGVASADMVAERPVITLMSGLAAGVLGCSRVGADVDRNNLITLDIGGTSADIGVITRGVHIEASPRDTFVAGYPIQVPMIDLHTIGAGGGSIARRETSGAFLVGPESAGAVPGPAAYGTGGVEATATDANVVLGRLGGEGLLGGRLHLDANAARVAVQRIADVFSLSLLDAAEGILAILNANMANAIRARTVKRGLDPRDYALIAAGGAGPLQCAEVARSLGIREVIVPPYPGLTSAIGLLTTDIRYDSVCTVLQMTQGLNLDRGNTLLQQMRDELVEHFRLDQVLPSQTSFRRFADFRYAGQGYELRVPLDDAPLDPQSLSAAQDRFHSQHAAEYGHSFAALPVEIVNLRVSGVGSIPTIGPTKAPRGGSVEKAFLENRQVHFRSDGRVQPLLTPFFRREFLPVGTTIPGPAMVLQPDSTTVVPPGCDFRCESSGALLIRVEPSNPRT
jgi:N-methylhydantoinase A